MKIAYLLISLVVVLSFTACEKPKSTNANCPEVCTNDPLLHKKRVLILGIDGCRPDALQQANTPALDKLVADGRYNYNTNRGNDHTWSGAGWSSMLTGVWPDKHGVVDNTFIGKNYDAYPHFFCRIKGYNDCYKLASICYWHPLNDDVAAPCSPDVICTYKEDYLVAEAVKNHVRDCTIDVVFVNFDDVDFAGHTYGFHPSVGKYITAIETIDGYCQSILEEVYQREQNNGEEWLVVVGTDHGGKIDGTHGNHDNDTEVTRTFSIYRTPNMTNKGLMNYDPAVVDVVPTILDYLSVPIDTLWGLDGTKVDLL